MLAVASGGFPSEFRRASAVTLRSSGCTSYIPLLRRAVRNSALTSVRSANLSFFFLLGQICPRLRPDTVQSRGLLDLSGYSDIYLKLSESLVRIMCNLTVASVYMSKTLSTSFFVCLITSTSLNVIGNVSSFTDHESPLECYVFFCHLFQWHHPLGSCLRLEIW